MVRKNQVDNRSKLHGEATMLVAIGEVNRNLIHCMDKIKIVDGEQARIKKIVVGEIKMMDGGNKIKDGVHRIMDGEIKAIKIKLMDGEVNKIIKIADGAIKEIKEIMDGEIKEIMDGEIRETREIMDGEIKEIMDGEIREINLMKVSKHWRP